MNRRLHPHISTPSSELSHSTAPLATLLFGQQIWPAVKVPTELCLFPSEWLALADGSLNSCRLLVATEAKTEVARLHLISSRCRHCCPVEAKPFCGIRIEGLNGHQVRISRVIKSRSKPARRQRRPWDLLSVNTSSNLGLKEKSKKREKMLFKLRVK